MAMRSSSSVVVSLVKRCRLMERVVPSSGSRVRCLSDGRVLSEEERAKETVYIQKMERERMEKMKKKAELEKANKDKADKKAEEGARKD